jgi:hypothetical protein
VKSETKTAVENMKENIEQAQRGYDDQGGLLAYAYHRDGARSPHKHCHPVLVLARLRGQPGRE